MSELANQQVFECNIVEDTSITEGSFCIIITSIFYTFADN